MKEKQPLLNTSNVSIIINSLEKYMSRIRATWKIINN